MSGRIWIGLALALLATAALAAGPGAVRKQAEASMLVTGQVRIEPDGSVSGWELDRRDTLPEVVTELIDRAITAWRFEPVLVDGKPAKVEAAMSLRLVANRLDDGGYQVSVRSSYFGDDAKGSEGMVKEGRADETVHAIQMRPPSYPPQAAKAGIRGTVYLVLRIDREGTVDDVFVEQVNLRNIGSERQMDLMRAVLAKPTAAAARKWTFAIPTAGEQAGNGYWSIRVPVAYMLDGERDAAYGRWETYIPGPRHRVPWDDGEPDPNAGPDALIAGGVYPAGKGIRLLTPLHEG